MLYDLHKNHNNKMTKLYENLIVPSASKMIFFSKFCHRVNCLADASCVKQDRFLTVALIRFESKGDRSTHFPVLYLPPSLFPYSNIPSYTPLLQNICIFVTNSHLKFREGFSQHYFMSHFN